MNDGIEIRTENRNGCVEVQGFVDGNQVYGVYIDKVGPPRVSTATAPSGSLDKSRRMITCMQQVISNVDKILELRRGEK